MKKGCFVFTLMDERDVRAVASTRVGHGRAPCTTPLRCLSSREMHEKDERRQMGSPVEWHRLPSYPEPLSTRNQGG
jgi:hypothetical protein